MNEQIAAATEQQSCVTEEINRNMVSIQDGYGDMKLNYENIEKCSQLVDALAKQLNERVKVLNI